MAANPWSKFFWHDWDSDPCVRACSLAAQALWMRMLCIAAKANPTGYVVINEKPIDLPTLARMCGCAVDEAATLMDELDRNGVFSRDRKGRIFNRRMVRDIQVSARQRRNGLDGGNPDLRRGTVPKNQRVRPFRRSDSPEKTRRIFEKKAGKCWWCGVQLITNLAPGQDLVPNFFHVDHLLPVCDGGTNDEENLVPACAKCNHLRARKDWINPTDTNPASNSDSKAQSPVLQSPEEAFVLKSEDDFKTSPHRVEKRKRKYPEQFETFWSGYPTDRNMSKLEAWQAWQRTDDDERVAAIESLPAFRAYCSSNKDYRPIHANRYLLKRRFEGHLAAGKEIAARQVITPKTAEWAAWRQHKIALGESVNFMDSRDEYSVPSQWPPGYVAPIKEAAE